MRKAAVSLIGVLCCTAILALAHDPRTTAKDFSHGLKIEGAGDLNLSYKAMHFNVATYKRMQEDGQFRARMNSGVWSNIGAAEAGFDVVLGDQALPRGKYTLGLSIDAQDAKNVGFRLPATAWGASSRLSVSAHLSRGSSPHDMNPPPWR